MKGVEVGTHGVSMFTLPGSRCSATKGSCAGYGVYPMIAYEIDTGYDGRCVASTTGNYSVCQDLLSGWCTPLQIVKASEVGTHAGPMFTMPVAVATQPRAVVQVMVYSQ